MGKFYFFIIQKVPEQVQPLIKNQIKPTNDSVPRSLVKKNLRNVPEVHHNRIPLKKVI